MKFLHKFSTQYIKKKVKEGQKGNIAHKYMCIHDDKTKASFTVNLYLGYVNENTREKSVYFQHIHVYLRVCGICVCVLYFWHPI